MPAPPPERDSPVAAPHPLEFRLFLRALADEIDSLAAPDERDRLLRGVGARMARLMPVPHVETLAALEIEMNDLLGHIGWGRTRLDLNEADQFLSITHTGLPRIGSLGSPAGQWLSALLEGLYTAWFAQQPGSAPNLAASRTISRTSEPVTLRYGRVTPS